ncbi:MAG: hypothetical protein ACQESR_15385 [Planctomycetota bacterium]
MDNEHENELGYQLKCRLAQFLADAGFKVIPPGTLGAGMGYRQSDDVAHKYDSESGVLTVTGITTIEVCRAYKDDDDPITENDAT